MHTSVEGISEPNALLSLHSSTFADIRKGSRLIYAEIILNSDLRFAMLSYEIAPVGIYLEFPTLELFTACTVYAVSKAKMAAAIAFPSSFNDCACFLVLAPPATFVYVPVI